MPQPLDALPTWILSSTAARASRAVHVRLAAAGVTGYEYRCLTALAAVAAVQALSQTELGEAAALDPRDVTHTVRALEERGLVARAKDPRHGRRQLVTLTDEGRVTADFLTAVMAEVQEEVFARLDRDERKALLALLGRVG